MRWNQRAGAVLVCAWLGAAACGAGDDPDANGADGCAAPAVADPRGSERFACAFTAGAPASATPAR